jgi:undecaprenyl-diphosphatase
MISSNIAFVVLILRQAVAMAIFQCRLRITKNLLQIFWNIITKFGEQTVIIILLCIIYWCINKKLAHIMGFTFFLSGYLVQGLKITFRIDRPWIKDPNFKPVSSAYETATGYSFPSGHTQAATSIYSSIGFYIKKWWRVLFFLIPLAVCFSRMYLGVHTPKDVLTALLLSIVISYLVSYLYKKADGRSMGWFLIVVILLGFVLIIYSISLYNQQIIEYQYVTDCCKTAGAGIGFAIGVFLEQKLIKFNTKTKHFHGQLIKIVLGIGGLLAIQIGLKEIFSLLFE